MADTKTPATETLTRDAINLVPTPEAKWWAWHDADSSRWYPTVAEAEEACAAWVAGESDVGPK